MTVAEYVLPLPMSVTETVVAPLITWLFVSTSPFEVSTIPVPSPAVLWYLNVELMSTIAGSTCSSIADEFFGPEVLGLEPGVDGKPKPGNADCGELGLVHVAWPTSTPAAAATMRRELAANTRTPLPIAAVGAAVGGSQAPPPVPPPWAEGVAGGVAAVQGSVAAFQGSLVMAESLPVRANRAARGP